MITITLILESTRLAVGSDSKFVKYKDSLKVGGWVVVGLCLDLGSLEFGQGQKFTWRFCDEGNVS